MSSRAARPQPRGDKARAIGATTKLLDQRDCETSMGVIALATAEAHNASSGRAQA